jgi:hypothetical protein
LVDDIVVRLGKLNVPTKDSDASACPPSPSNMASCGGTRLPAMLIHESRILRVTIFGTLHESLSLLDFNPLLPDVMTIADEVDSQLTQTMESFTNGSSKSAKAQLVKRGDEFRLKTCF